MDSKDVFLSIAALLIVIVFSTLGYLIIHLITKVQKNYHENKKSSWAISFAIPPLIGMIILGCFARNVIPGEVMDHYNETWASYIRMICLAVILLRGGLELEFKGKGLLVVLLIFIPSGFEATSIALTSQAIFHLPITFAFSLGFVFSAVSPAILVPSLMNLHMEGYGSDKGIPVSLIASGSLEDALMITLFGICTTIGWNDAGVTDASLGLLIARNVYEVFGGIIAGIILGLFMKLIIKTSLKVKCFASFFISIGFIIICEVIKANQSKYVGVIAYGYVCFRVWGNDKPKKELALIWNYMTPFLFGSIGAAVQFKIIDGSVISKSIGLVFIGVIIRCIVAFLVAGVRRDFFWKEKLFIGFAWLPKATIQAALGGLVLDMAREQKEKLGERSQEYIEYGLEILTVTVFAIVITAPLGAILINTLGPIFLEKKKEKHKADQEEMDTNKIFA